MVQLGEAIDFRKLLKEEKKRARELMQHQKRNNGQEGSATPPLSEPPIPKTLPPWSSATTSIPVPQLDREMHCISSNPPSIFYLQHFLPHDYCQDLWNWLEGLPSESARPSESPSPACWHELPHAKRKVALFATSCDNDSFSRPLQILVDALLQAGVFPSDLQPNHILVNEYTPDQGIMPHTDGPAYASRTATISLGDGGVLLQFSPRLVSPQEQEPADATQVLLHGGGSLVVFEEEAYLNYLHSINELQDCVEYASAQCRNAPPGTRVERQPRMSLTVRHCRANSF
jgi:alkylated DNA repair protein alkB family protein 6